MLQLHPAEDIIAGAVDDSVNMGNPVAHETLAQGLDNRNAPGHAGFVIKIGPMLARRGEQLLAVRGNQRLVGRDHRLAQPERCQDHGLGKRRSADQLDDGVDPRVLRDAGPIGGHQRGRDRIRARLVQGLDGDFAQADAEADAGFQQGAVPAPVVINTAAHRPSAD